MEPGMLQQFMATQAMPQRGQLGQMNMFPGQPQMAPMMRAGQLPAPVIPSPRPSISPSSTKKRKLGNGQTAIDEADMDDDVAKSMGSKQSLEAKRSQHCEVEKKRRERMNRYMSELAQMIPACNAVPRKLDKLSILKMAVDHMKNLQGDSHTPTEYKPGFLTDDELKKLIVEAANGFMVIIECSEAKVLYVSDTITDVLQEKPEQWIGSCLYDMLHHKDITKVREQLACFDADGVLKESSAAGIQNSPLVMHSQSLNGLRRSFLCRVKKTVSTGENIVSTETKNYSNSENFIKLLHPHETFQYAVLHCTGFIRNLTTTERRSLRVDDSTSGTCLVAVARLQRFGEDGPKVGMETSENEFVTRVAVDGRFSYVDPRVSGVLGYLPQDLIGQVSYEYYHPDDIQKMVHLHHEAMKHRTPMPTVKYRFLCKDHKWLSLAMKAFAFVNPFSQQVEYVVCTNIVMRSEPKDSEMHSERAQMNSDLRCSTMSIRGPTDAVLEEKQQEMMMSAQQQSMMNDPLSMLLFPSGPAPAAAASTSNIQFSGDVTRPAFIAPANNGAAISTPAAITIEENAATAQHILDEYNRLHTLPPVNKDMNFTFPPGLFNGEVDLKGSEYPYRHLLQDLENPEEFTELFKQVPANPLKLPNAFQDLDLFD